MIKTVNTMATTEKKNPFKTYLFKFDIFSSSHVGYQAADDTALAAWHTIRQTIKVGDVCQDGLILICRKDPVKIKFEIPIPRKEETKWFLGAIEEVIHPT